MSEPRDERIETNPDADLAEVLRDDALLDAIGASREPAFAALPDDDVTRLLTAWQSDAATYADERTGPPIPVPVEVPVTPATERPAADPIPHRRRHARPARGGRFAPRSAAAISAAAVAGVVLSVGGVAAAVTGSPLTPLRAVVSGFAPATDQDGAADVTSVTPRELASVRTAIKDGHLDEARRKLTDAREQAETLDPGPEQVNTLVVIEDLEERLELAEQQGTTPGSATANPSPSATPTDNGSGTPTPTPSASESPTPTPTAEPTPTSSAPGNGQGQGQGRGRASPGPPLGAGYDGGSLS